MSMTEPERQAHSHESYKADFHIHTLYSPDSFMSPEALVKTAVRKNMTCLAVTDHNTVRGALAVQEIAPFRVIIGEEVSSADGEIIGLFLTETIPRDLSAQETVRRIKDQGGIVQVPHPFDRFRRGHIKRAALMDILSQVDIIEAFNARTSFRRDVMAAATFVQEQRAHHSIVPTAVTDSHTPYEIGRTWVEMPAFASAADFVEALSHGRLEGHLVTPLIHVATRFTKLSKRWIRPTP